MFAFRAATLDTITHGVSPLHCQGLERHSSPFGIYLIDVLASSILADFVCGKVARIRSGGRQFSLTIGEGLTRFPFGLLIPSP